MKRPLILSVFPGVDLLGRAFEIEWPEACAVRGPDRLWGGDIRTFHPPAGVFDGVIGGPPCQAFSSLRHLVQHHGHPLAEDLIPEFVRVVEEAAPRWFLMENVPDAPEPEIVGYGRQRHVVVDAHVGGETRRRRAFTFGRRDAGDCRLMIEWSALHSTQPAPAVLASGGAAMGASVVRGGTRRRLASALGNKSTAYMREAIRLQGLPEDFLDGAPFTVRGKIRCIGNGVPMALGRAIARAVKRQLAAGPE